MLLGLWRAKDQPNPLLGKHLQGSSTCISVVLNLLTRFGLSLKGSSLWITMWGWPTKKILNIIRIFLHICMAFQKAIEVCVNYCVATGKAVFASSLLGNELVRRNFVTAWSQGQYWMRGGLSFLLQWGCSRWTLAGCQAPTKASVSLPSTAGQGRENITKGS